jgi:hypothetical protein
MNCVTVHSGYGAGARLVAIATTQVLDSGAYGAEMEDRASVVVEAVDEQSSSEMDDDAHRRLLERAAWRGLCGIMSCQRAGYQRAGRMH